MGPVEGLRRNREGVGCLPGRSGFCRALLGRVDKDGQHGHGKEDAYGVRHSGIVNGGTLSGLAVQQAAQALRCQHEVAGTAVIQKFFFSLKRYMEAAHSTIMASVWLVQLK